MTNSPIIRRLTRQDKDVLQALLLSTQTNEPAPPWASNDDFWRAVSDEKWDTLLRVSEENTGDVLLGAFPSPDSKPFEIGGIIGLRCEPRPTTRHKASLFGLYVVPCKRRQGIGTELVSALIAEAKAAPHLEMLRLVALAENAPLIALLHKQGFHTYAVEPHARFLEGNYYDLAFLYRFLAETGTAQAEQGELQ